MIKSIQKYFLFLEKNAIVLADGNGFDKSTVEVIGDPAEKIPPLPERCSVYSMVITPNDELMVIGSPTSVANSFFENFGQNVKKFRKFRTPYKKSKKYTFNAFLCDNFFKVSQIFF